MSYEFELDEWRRAVGSMGEMERAATQVDLRAAAGMCGDKEDDMYGEGWEGEE